MATDTAGNEKQYKIEIEGSAKVIKVDFSGSIYSPSIEDSPEIMARVFDVLLESGAVQKISFIQREEYVYSKAQADMLYEIVEFYKQQIKEGGLLQLGHLRGSECEKYALAWHDFLNKNVLQGLKQDPIGSYVEIKRRIREEQIKQKEVPNSEEAICAQAFLQILQALATALEKTKLIRLAGPYLAGYKAGGREIYARFFRPSVQPFFIYTKLVTQYPAGAEEIDSYEIAEDARVLILKVPHDVRLVYHIMPAEFNLAEDRYALLTAAREVLAEHRPERSEFANTERTREIFFSISRDLLSDIARERGIKLSNDELAQLATILVRYTIGFGLIEIILSDEKIQDLVVNSPLGANPISIIHADYGECKTNIVPLPKEGESWATKLRLISGRPLDEANPVLDSDLTLPYARARVAALQRPLSPAGYAFAFRRHRDKSWTLPLFIKVKMLTPMAAGLISFLADNARTMLIAGTRSAGKTSLLGAVLVELSRNNRIITSEDTLELPVDQLRHLGYDILSMKTRSVITGAEAEVPAEQAIRTALRLGDSALILGEVRSVEARALYEAMRVGALAKLVAGTIHGDSPYSVYDRVVNDLGVPKTSFKATDIILVANSVTSPSGLEQWRRLTNISEVRKYWTEDPLAEKGFADLMAYNAKNDVIEPTDVLLEGESEILKAVGGRVKEWAGNWDAIWQNIELRAKVKQALVDTSNTSKNSELLEAPFVIKANDQFHKISQAVAEEVGTTEPTRVFNIWNDWLKGEVKKGLKS